MILGSAVIFQRRLNSRPSIRNRAQSTIAQIIILAIPQAKRDPIAAGLGKGVRSLSVIDQDMLASYLTNQVGKRRDTDHYA